MSDDKGKDTKMDPVVISSLIVLATNLTNMIVKNCDPNLTPPKVADLAAKLGKLELMEELPEEYDAGLVNDALEYIKDKFGL